MIPQIVCDKEHTEEEKWYVMHRHALSAHKVREKLRKLEFTYFQPQSLQLETVNGRKQKVLKYTLPDYFFIRSTFRKLEPLSKPDEPLRLTFNLNICSGRQNDYLIVPDVQMRNFMLMATAYDENPQYLSLDDEKLKNTLKSGVRVRVIGGPFDGCEGRYVQISRGKKRQLVVAIEGIIGITAHVDPDFIEILDEE